jgi:U3 small nucleolar RNA-associated protein 21
LPTGNLVDVFKVDDVATSVTFSPTGDFLATTHVDNVGIFLWANKTQFSNVSLRSITDDEVATLVSLPTASGLDEGVEVEVETGADDDEDIDTKTEQLADDMITLSLLPRSKWQNLLNLETIKLRNKPKEAPKAPEKAPFFLPTLPGVVSKFAAPENIKEIENDRDMTNNFSSDYQHETEFTRLLRAGHENGDCKY